MDKGRQIDNIQNVNARFIDNFGASQKTSVKTSNPPGGKSNFSLGWDNDEPVKQKKTVTNNPYNDVDSGKNRQKSKNDVQVDQNLKNYYNPYSEQQGETKEKTSVKQAPGGSSNICFGYENINYNDFKKNI